MDTVMMSTMLPAAILMAETVVDLMLIQLFAQNVNANKEEEEVILNFQLR